MKMGTIASLFPYDPTACYALQSVSLRLSAILHYGSWAAVFSISRVVQSPFNSGPFDQFGNGVLGKAPSLS